MYLRKGGDHGEGEEEKREADRYPAHAERIGQILHFTVLVLVLFGSVMIVDINVGQTSSNNMVVITTAVNRGCS